MLKIRLSAAAELDIDQGVRYYNRQQAGLGVQFLTAIKKTLKKMRQMPQAASISYDDVRYKVVENFPFIITYSYDDKHIGIFRVFNTNLDPDKL
jgi:plasmid stabilization system protein ParE